MTVGLINERIRRRREERIKRIQYDRKQDDTIEWTVQAPSVVSEINSEPQNEPPFYRRIKGAIVVSICLFASVWLLFQLPYPWAGKGQLWVEEVFTREFDYERMMLWYEEQFTGSPAFLPSFFDKGKEFLSKPAQGTNDKLYAPTSGKITTPFQSSSPGIWIEGNDDQRVYALAAGWVIYADRSTEHGFTVIIQHADRMQSVYANLVDVDLKKNDWVEGGEQIGQLIERDDRGTYPFFFAIKKDEQYLDPQDVVTFD